MRVLHVSAHFPPNFVSGGTLVPQRLARAQRARGHDVAVYAGFLDEHRAPLETWDETDETGLPVRWIVSTPWIGWADRRNTDNADVALDFAAYLREFRPHVVHIHSLQSLGAGLLTAAHDSDARTVVTMHDFWWVCARQFLVAPDLRPCSLVVSCGSCPCQVDHAWLDARNRWLADQLVHADLVFAPSEIAARVLRANGLARGRINLDENSLPPGPIWAPPVTSTGPVRFFYAGGDEPLKGVDVVRDAAARLRDATGWSLDLYGVPATRVSSAAGSADAALDFGAADAAVGVSGAVRAVPPYRPDELGDVLAAHDVLVLPSLMRESHSILTREALTHGLAVICTDTLGPEEVVESGVNGIVVPAGDPGALALAMRSLAADRDLLARLRAARTQVRIRPLDDQLDALDRSYEALLSDPTPPAIRTVRDVLFVVGIDGAPLRYRARLPAEALLLAGVRADVRHYRDETVPALAAQADAVVFYRVPATVQILTLISHIKRRPEPVPVLFDVDDLIFDPTLRGELRGLDQLPEAEENLWWQGVRRYRTTMEHADGYVGGTEALCAAAARVVGIPSYRFANGTGVLLARASEQAMRRERSPGPLRIGYFSGTTTHDQDWASIEPAVAAALTRHPEVELWLGGYLNPTDALARFGDRVRRIPFLPWDELCTALRDLDVNLAPLAGRGPFNEAKSAIKWLEAALVGTPTVASPTQPFAEAIDHGRNGYLAGDAADWAAALDALLTDDLRRARVGAEAHRDALLTWGPHLQGIRYQELLEAARARVLAEGHRAPSPTWVTEASNEPWTAVSLEPYGSAAVALPPPRSRRVWARQVAGRVRAVRRERGTAALAGSALRAAQRRLTN